MTKIEFLELALSLADGDKVYFTDKNKETTEVIDSLGEMSKVEVQNKVNEYKKLNGFEESDKNYTIIFNKKENDANCVHAWMSCDPKQNNKSTISLNIARQLKEKEKFIVKYKVDYTRIRIS